MTDRLPRRVHAGYAAGSLVTGAFGTVPGLLLLPYLTDTLGVSAVLAGFVVFAPKGWDVLINPLVGRISDRTHTRWGARRPYLLAGGLVTALLFAAIFAAPLPGSAEVGYVLLAFLATATAFAFFQVPYVAMPAEITDDYAERTHLMTWRVALLAVAILLAGGLAPLIVTATGGGVVGHRWMGAAVATVMALGALLAFAGTAKAPTGHVTATATSLREQLRLARHNRPFTILLTVFVLQTIGVATMLAAVPYIATHVLGMPGIGASVMFACFVGPAILVMPLWSRLADAWGKRRCLILAAGLMTAAAAGMLGAGSPFAAYPLATVVGIGYAGQQVFAMAMLPDCVAHDAVRTGRRQAGVFTGLWTAGETLAMALGPGVFALVLGLSGYESSDTGVAAAQSATAGFGLLLGFSLLPALLIGPVTLLLRRYRLDDRSRDTAAALP